MWECWDAAAVERELAEVAALGIQAVRIFLRWRDFQPTATTVSGTALGKLDEFLARANRQHLKVVPTFFTGHMSGENYDVPWREGRCPYTDAGMLRAQSLLVRTLGLRYRNDSTVLFWDLANEPDIFLRPPTAEAGWLWARFLADELRTADPQHPVTVGVHLGCLTEDLGFRPADLADACDFLCMHTYPMYTSLCPDPPLGLRAGYLASFAARLAAGMGGKPVLLEEFGTSSHLWGEAESGLHHAVVLGSLLANGALGAYAWCFGDFSCGEELPYESTPYEAAFGLTDQAGGLKETGAAWRRFADFLRQGRLAGYEPEPTSAAILIPQNFYDHPDGLTPEHHARVLFNAFILAKQAGLDVDFLPAQKAPGDYRLLILPSVPRRAFISTSGWRRLREYVAEGGILCLSYDGFAAEGLDEIAGCEIRGPVPVEGDISFADRGLGGDLTCSGRAGKRLLVRPRGGRWLATDAIESGGVLEHRTRQGAVLFATYPLELDLGIRPDPYTFDRSHLIYRRAGELAKLPMAVSHPAVETRVWRQGKRRLLLAVNHAAEGVAAVKSTGGALRLAAGETRLCELPEVI